MFTVPGILITGGGYFDDESAKSVEIFSLQSNTSCTLKSLPSPARSHVQYGNMICTEDKWCMERDERTGHWSLSHKLKFDRSSGSVWEVEDGVILMGGGGYYSDSSNTSERVRNDGEVEQTFDLQYDTR